MGFVDANIHLIWVFVLSLPVPKSLPRGNESVLPWTIFLAFYLGVMLTCAALKQRGVKLRKLADKAQDILDLQAPLLMQRAVNGAGVMVGGINGDNNTVNATNRVLRVIKEGEKESNITKILVAVAIPIVTWLLSHYLHVT